MVENKYCLADLEIIVKCCKILDVSKQPIVSMLLNQFKHLFDGTLRHWNTEPVDLQLKLTCSLNDTLNPPLSRERTQRQSLKTCRIWALQKVN
jgi:hypothetical protein